MRRLEFFFALNDVLSTVDSLGLLLYRSKTRKVITLLNEGSLCLIPLAMYLHPPQWPWNLGSNNAGHKFEQLLNLELQSYLSLAFHTDVSTINHFQCKNKATKYLGQLYKQFIHRICRKAGDQAMEGLTAESDSSVPVL